MQLFPGWTGAPDDNSVRQSEFRLARLLTDERDPELPDEKIVKVSSLDEEMQQMGIEMAMMNLFRYLFVVDPESRPSAIEALASKEYADLKKAALGGEHSGD